MRWVGRLLSFADMNLLRYLLTNCYTGKGYVWIQMKIKPPA
ncbi:hypothetical protein FCV48_14205 [Vibrio alginolyticus]|uniref:Uncharacterized protein n=1 Tax=Vibrio alginolyticus TaxID=663 RepID=A0A7Y4B576_VIBAL|nr:hypothetical protein [Vibrio alginolyticus]TKF07991.1 hypothetical protein FCV48_14205 [Vibrio alginolyticus]